MWADEHSGHILIDGDLVKIVPSDLTTDDQHHSTMRGALRAGPPPAAPSVARVATLPADAVIEVDRGLDNFG